MRLRTKLTLFITLSKLAVVLLFVLMLPYLVEEIAFTYTNNYLQEQKKKVMQVIAKDGIDYYLQGEDSYGSYTMLKEEYISLEEVNAGFNLDTIETTQRVFEGTDTLEYRLLSHTFNAGNSNYLLEIGKTTATINQYNRPLQRIASYVLVALILLTTIIDLFYTRFLLRPLELVIKSKLVDRKFPFNEDPVPIQTSTSDFQYLDKSLILLMDQIHEAFEKEREFTANASHELMTPISILQNKIENLMADAEVTPQVQQRLVEMHRTLNRLKKIVSSLLLISRIDNEQFTRGDEVVVNELFEDVMEDISHRLEEHEIRFQMQLSNVLLKNCNRDLLFQLVYNLINNAIKYNKPQGSISVTDNITDPRFYTIMIADTGIGIPQDDLPTIFNRFKKSNLSEGGGYGLGLSIVQSIVQYHGYTISVESAVGKGTAFKLTIPQSAISF
ncbi:cell wall metabolism sensor histidine kinase WalK [Pedobacter sp. SYSU D00535]|uniref:sensor histidine kinase n=1 Tax=Pedobacter sp. SYSU D00535 TaxID=2810308 RepID=UPI001A9565EE|nr:HAMP domain-containing sensor histidine kinase [Pedobacter sp. SYSU D00535]